VQVKLMEKKRMGFLSAGNLQDPLRRDELYDLE